ncbi:MAG: carboxypeptidase regulatory-like domain-containing protein [Pyrinomonadaceae bacterium]
MFGSIFIRVSAFTLLFVVSVAVSFAQDLDDVTISGKITDSAGLAVVGAIVSASSIETGESRTVVTDDEGRYRIVKLKPGTYKIKTSLSGFGTQETPEVTTVSAQNVQKDFKLAPAGVTAEQTITVTDDDGPVVDTTRITVGGTITEREIEEIPNNTRNALDLVLTLGGTSEEQLSTSGLAEDRNASVAPLEQGNYSLSGGTAYSNNVTIDGLDNNDDRTSRDRFQPSLESIAEVQVIANQFSAEYGRASGGRVNLRTRAGGKKFRGRAFFFFRDESLNANSWYNNAHIPYISRPPLQEINPGFTFSGPVIIPFYNGRQKTFFSVAYERNKLADTTVIDAYVPIAANPRYTLPAPTGTTLSCDASGLPPPPCASGVGTLGPYNKFFNTPNTSDVFTARVDTKLFKNNDFTFGYQFGRKNNKRTSGTAPLTRIENALQEKNSNTDAYNFTDNHVFGSKAVNQVRAQFSRFQPSFQTQAPLDPVVLISYRDPVTTSVRTLVAGNSTASRFSSSNTTIFFPESRNETRWQIQDSLVYLPGSHTFKLGFDIQNIVSKDFGLGDATGTFDFGSVANYTSNILRQYIQTFGTSEDVKNKYIGVFFNDQMKIGSNVTMSYGLRYERETAVSDNNNFGPRLGVAWDPFKTGKGVIRFGAGIFYNRVLLRTVGNSIQNKGGSQVTFNSDSIGASATDTRRTFIAAAIGNAIFPGRFASVEALRAFVASVCPTIPSQLGPCNSNTGFSVGNVSSAGNPLRSVDANLRIPESYQFNVGFEREVKKGWVFEANYTWNKTVHLWRDSNANVAVLPAGYADWNAWLLANNTFVLSSARRYTFFMGDPTDSSGLHIGSATGATPCTTTTPNCFVNLNTTSTSTTPPTVAVVGSNGNSTGGPIGIATAAIAQFRPDQTVGQTSRIGSRGNAFYQGLILELRSRYRKLGAGFSASLRAAYTLSKTMDDGLNNTSNAEINGDFSREWARNLQDRRHRFALSGTFDTPRWFGKLKFSPLFRFGTSAPFNLGIGTADRNLDDVSGDRLNFSGNIEDIKYRNPGAPDATALLAQFSLAPIGAKSGNLPRNAGTGPSFYTFDLSVTREWKLSDRMKLRPVMQFDNILNAAVFSYGSEFINFTALNATQTPAQVLARQNFLVPTRTYRQRQIRLGIRFDF